MPYFREAPVYAGAFLLAVTYNITVFMLVDNRPPKIAEIINDVTKATMLLKSKTRPLSIPTKEKCDVGHKK